MRSATRLLCTIVVAAALASACGGDSAPTPPGSATEPPPSSTGGPQGPTSGAGSTAKPPPAFASGPGRAPLIPLGIGTYCWTEPGKTGLCADAIGPVTGTQPLTVARGSMVSISNPVQGSPIQRGSVSAWPAPAQPYATTATEIVWSVPPAGATVLQASVTATGVDFAANLDPGRYTVVIRLFFAPSNDVSYGLLLDVR